MTNRQPLALAFALFFALTPGCSLDAPTGDASADAGSDDGSSNDGDSAGDGDGDGDVVGDGDGDGDVVGDGDGDSAGDGDGDGDVVGDGDGDGDAGGDGDGDGSGGGDGDGPGSWICNADYFGTNDGCDCGCGIHDPDCGEAYAIDACEYAFACGELSNVDPDDTTSCLNGTVAGGDGDGDGDGEGGGDITPVDGEPALLEGITSAHNDVRANIDSPPPASPLSALTWNNTIAAVAQAYAEECVWEHSQGNGYGENLYASSGPPGGPNVVYSWASEVDFYDYESDSCQPGEMCGHYTQVVWASTTEVGCGIAHCTNGISGLPWSSGYVVVCNYNPPGNYVGQRPYQD